MDVDPGFHITMSDILHVALEWGDMWRMGCALYSLDGDVERDVMSSSGTVAAEDKARVEIAVALQC